MEYYKSYTYKACWRFVVVCYDGGVVDFLDFMHMFFPLKIWMQCYSRIRCRDEEKEG